MSQKTIEINPELGRALEGVCNKYLRPDVYTADLLADSTPGVSVLASINGKVVADFCKGYAQRYSDRDGQELPKDQWVSFDKNSIFDCKCSRTRC
jgi:hypothetical protein